MLWSCAAAACTNPRVYPHMHWRAPWGRGMTATLWAHTQVCQCTQLHSLGHGCTLPCPKPHSPPSGTWLYAAPPQAPLSTHWGMAVRCPTPSPTLHSLGHGCTLPTPSPTLHSLGHDCTLPLPEPPGSSFQTVNIPNMITRHRSKKRTNGIMYCCNIAARLGEAEPAKMAQRSHSFHCSTLCTHNIP